MGKVSPLEAYRKDPALLEVLVNKHGEPLTRESFHEFLSKAYSSEVLDFWTHTEQFRSETLGNSRAPVVIPVVALHTRGETVRKILLDEFLAPNSVREVNLDSVLRGEVIEVVKGPRKDKGESTATLDKAQIEVEAMMMEPFNRFLTQVGTKNVNSDERTRRFGMSKRLAPLVIIVLGSSLVLELAGLVPLYVLRPLVFPPLWYLILNTFQAYFSI